MSELFNPDTIDVPQMLAGLEADLKVFLAERNIKQPLVVGIHTGGVWIAEYLHQKLGITSPLSTLDISFYRDDFTRVGLNPKVKSSSMPLATEGQHIILVDDVVMSGRTVRAALNELFDYGRPASVSLVSLLDLSARELPIRPDVTAMTVVLPAGQRVKLTGPEPLRLELQTVTTEA